MQARAKVISGLAVQRHAGEVLFWRAAAGDTQPFVQVDRHQYPDGRIAWRPGPRRSEITTRENHMPHKDFRSFLAAIESSGDLVTIDDEVDWDQELSGIGRLSCERNGPAFMFNNIKDYSPQWRIATNPIATWRRLAVGLNLPADTPLRDLYKAYEEREGTMIPPVFVKDGPCKEVIIPADKANLFDLPVPMVHEGDGGRYLGTWDLVVSKDANSEWVNWGMYRFMIHNERHMTGYPRPTSHLGKMLLEGYVPRGKRMPIAIVIGADLPSHIAAAATFRLAGNEADLAGGLGGHPIELVAAARWETRFVPVSRQLRIGANRS
jgi:4-hydroxy-3-polyprenylbenzoate decarboxylase